MGQPLNSGGRSEAELRRAGVTYEGMDRGQTFWLTFDITDMAHALRLRGRLIHL
jgi:hypothetical protein